MPSPLPRGAERRPRLRVRPVRRVPVPRPTSRRREEVAGAQAWIGGSRWRLVVQVVVIAAICAAGIGLYLNERTSREREQFAGPAAGADYLLLEVVVQRVDPGGLSMATKVLAQPQGALAAPDSPLAPAVDLQVETTSLEHAALRFPARQRIGVENVPFSLLTGRVSDYPFDRYQSLVGFVATAGDRPVPVRLELINADPFFVLRNGGEQAEEGSVLVTERLSRSRSTFILAWFMIVAMWALALAVLTAAWLITAQRRGLVWPALGWMAATLFALVGMRNAAPGNPPIGSLLDYAAFFWAEALIAVALTAVVVRGSRVELRKSRAPR